MRTRPFRRSLFTLLVCVLVWCATPAIAHADQPKAAPQAVFDKLKDIDKRIDDVIAKTIPQVQANAEGAADTMDTEVEGIDVDFDKLIREDFPDVFGVGFYSIYRPLDKVDSSLELAAEVTDSDRRNVDLKQAKKQIVEELEKAIDKGTGVPEKVGGKTAEMKNAIDELRDDLRHGKFHNQDGTFDDAAFKTRVRAIEKIKHGMLSNDFPKVFGRNYEHVFSALHDVQDQLAFTHSAAINFSVLHDLAGIKKALERARKRKKELEAELLKALACPPKANGKSLRLGAAAKRACPGKRRFRTRGGLRKRVETICQNTEESYRNVAPPEARDEFDRYLVSLISVAGAEASAFKRMASVFDPFGRSLLQTAVDLYNSTRDIELDYRAGLAALRRGGDPIDSYNGASLAARPDKTRLREIYTGLGITGC